MCFPFLKMFHFIFLLRIPVKCAFLHKADDGFSFPLMESEGGKKNNKRDVCV